MSIWKEIVEVTEKAFRLYPNDIDRALKYIDRKLKAMKIAIDIRRDILANYENGKVRKCPNCQKLLKKKRNRPVA